jgi:LmbE family N-acetylglucosaminyl deacetylase
MLGMKPSARVVVLGAHPDDGEFGCGATMARLVEEGAEVWYAMFSPCEESVPAGFPRDVLRTEAMASSRVLGLAEDRLIFHDFPVRKFPQYRQEILEAMVLMRKDIQPDLVILPSNQDLHQDHATIAAEGWRAFKSCSLLGYEVAWNNLTFTTHLFVTLSEAHVQKKIAALRAYESQQFRSYAKDSFIHSLAEVRGTQVGQPLAEAFEVKRWIL